MDIRQLLDTVTSQTRLESVIMYRDSNGYEVDHVSRAFETFACKSDIVEYLTWWNYHQAAYVVDMMVMSGYINQWELVQFAAHVAPDWVGGDEFARLLCLFAGHESMYETLCNEYDTKLENNLKQFMREYCNS